MCWSILGCVAFSVDCHTDGARKCKMRRIGVLKTGLDLAAAALCIEWGMGGSYIRVIYCNAYDKKRWGLGYG